MLARMRSRAVLSALYLELCTGACYLSSNLLELYVRQIAAWEGRGQEQEQRAGAGS